MEYRFNAEEWAKLSPDERVLRCRFMASEARKLAETGKGTMREIYLALGKDWQKLADEIEDQSRS